MRLKISLILVLLTNITLFAQVKIGDNPSDINPTSILELESTDKVFVLTRMDNAVMQSLLLNPDLNKRPLQGALVYNTTDKCVFMYNGAAWVSLCNLATSSIKVTPAPTAPTLNNNLGDFWINTTTNQTSLFDGTNWVLLNSTTNTGSSVKITTDPTAPANPNNGDFWVTNNETKIWDATTSTWVLLNSTTNTGSSVNITTDPTAPTNPNNGDFWVTNNETKIWDATTSTWVLLNPTTNTTSTVEITKQPAAPANPNKGDFWINTTTNQTNIYNGTAWVLLNENPKKGTGVPTNITAPNSVAGDIYVDTATGTIYAHNGTAWVTQTSTSTGIKQEETVLTAATLNQVEFLVDLKTEDKINVYRNGVRVGFTVNAAKTGITLEPDAKCYTGDQIRIVQIY
ncbi:hypothetical protein [Tenacibaculum finnmarkense]|uniref:hypothetical protein n=1 Tax=Tenacibaculum finnmarkense TaxID=2781243 RepID=UPI001E5EE1DD|nr:hypothetical protein [Tenacibaculum finnmarkense]MCD8400062.1 hypothetical protein [Tenacibaculum finnmarkense genomovar ulcerans]